MINKNKKYEKLSSFFIATFYWFNTLLLLFDNFKENLYKKEVISFIVIFNILLSLLAICLFIGDIKINSITKYLNLNLFVLGLGFLYKYIYFLHFRIDIIYYFSLKDYIINTFNILIIAFISCIILFISTILTFNTNKKIKSPSYINKEVIELILITVISFIVFVFVYILTKSFNIGKIDFFRAYPLAISISNFFTIIVLSKYLFKKNIIREKENTFILSFFFFIGLVINSAYLNIYRIIGSEEKKLESLIQPEVYKNKKIFKIESTEKYDFYISKPNNELFIFERDYKVRKKSL